MSVTSSVAHGILGCAGWLLSGNFDGARGYLIIGGLAYFALSLSGVVGEHATIQIGVAVLMVWSGMWLGRAADGARIR